MLEFVELSELLACTGERWSPRIGDPSVMGWATVVSYFFAAVCCAFAATATRRDKRFWILLALFLMVLGVNKQLDLQSALTAIGRCLAQLQGWYGQRREVQFVFILGLVAVSGLIMLIMLFRVRHNIRGIGVALIGFGFLLTFVVVRAVGFHHFDVFINRVTFGGIRMNVVMEMAGIILIMTNAITATYRYSRRRSRV